MTHCKDSIQTVRVHFGEFEEDNIFFVCFVYHGLLLHTLRVGIYIGHILKQIHSLGLFNLLDPGFTDTALISWTEHAPTCALTQGNETT